VLALLAVLHVGGTFGAEGMEKQIQLDIPAGTSLEDALLQWGDRTGMQVMMSTDVVRNEKVQAIKGTTRAATALSTMLRGAGLSYTIDGNTVHVIPATTLIPPGSRLRLSDSSNEVSDFGTKTQVPSEGNNQTTEDNIKTAQLSAAPNQNDSHGKGMEEIVVTAQKRAERLQDVPISISVLGGQDLDKSNFAGVSDALNTVPNVFAFENQLQYGGTLLSIRGVAPAGGFAYGPPTVGYYVDSVPFGMMRSAVVPDPNIYDLKQIEVLRGPQGTLYGANALVGVVRVLTNEPDLNNFDFRARGDFSSTESGGENYGGNMAVNIPIVDGVLAARAVVGDDHESGWINGPLGEHINYSDTGNDRLKISWQPSEALSVQLSAWHSQAYYNAPSEAYANFVNAAVHPQPQYTQFNAYGAHISYKLPWFELSSQTSYVDYVNNNQYDITPFGYAEVLSTNFDSHVLTEEVNLTSTLDSPWRWSAGAMYRKDKDHYSQPYVNYPPVAPTVTPGILDDFDDSSKSAAVFGELGQRFFNNTLEWTLGLRYFRDEESSYPAGPVPGIPPNAVTQATSSATTPRAVLSWYPSKDLTTYVSYSQGFRSGVPQDELIGAVVPDFPALKPDKLSNYEVGIKGTLWDQRLAYDAAVFYMRWQDIQQEVGVPFNGLDIFALVNGGDASGQGAEFSLTARPVQSLTFTADFGWNNLHFDSTVLSSGAILFPEGSRPNFSPEYTAGLSARYTFLLGSSGLRGALSASGNFNSPMSTTYLSVGEVQANSLVAARGSFTIEFPEHWDVALWVENANNWNGSQFPLFNPKFAFDDARIRPRTYGVRFDYHLR